MDWRAAGLLGVGGLLGVSCLTQGLRAPEQAGQGWACVTSSHFSVYSDLDEAEANRVVAGLEEIYDLLGGVVFGEKATPAFHTDAIVFQRPTDMRQFIGDAGGAYRQALPNDFEPRPTLFVAGTLSPLARLIVAHELTHRFNHVALGATPPWLNEGLADYYETIRSEQGKAIVGEIDPRYQCTPDGLGALLCFQYEQLAGKTLPKASQVIQLDYPAFYAAIDTESGPASWRQNLERTRHYGVAWLLVHMLMKAPLPYAESFRRALAEPNSPHKGALLDQLVRQVPAAELDRDVKAYLQKSMPWRQRHAPPAKPLAEVERRALVAGEVHLLWARLDSFEGKNAERARAQLEAARQGSESGEPAFWLGRFYQVRGDTVAAERNYKQALELGPSNPDYLYGLLHLYWSDRDGQTWLEAARSEQVTHIIADLSKWARTAQQWNAVAAHQLVMDDVSAALTSSARACSADPDCWSCFHNRAAVLFASGDAAEAARAELDALNRLPESAPPALLNAVAVANAFYVRASRDPTSVTGHSQPSLLAP